MAASPLPRIVSVDEYLGMEFEADMDYVDGILEERNLGEFDHGDLQLQIAFLFRANQEKWQVRAVVETRVQVSPTRFRIPDVCILPASWQRTQIIREAPALCIEVLSPEDRLSRVLTRCEDFHGMGVPEVWIFHPARRHVLVVRPGAVIETIKEGTLTLAGTPISLPLGDVFSALDA